MPVKLRSGKARAHRITPEAVALWLKLNEIADAGQDEAFEPNGRRNEFIDAQNALDMMLGVKPWMESPFSVWTPEAPEYMHRNPAAVEDWANAWELRQELEAATGRG